MSQESTSSGIKDSQRTAEPRMYTVFIHNDDFTPMDFVVDLLVEVFRKPVNEAFAIMMTVHRSERGAVGRYSYDMARTKIDKATRMARNEGYPLRLSCEPES